MNLSGRGELAAQLYRQLLDALLDGRLVPGQRMPPTRSLAARLDVSRNTVALAYERLTAEGFLVGRAGAGTYVRTGPLEPARARAAPAGSGLRPRALWRSVPPAPTGVAGRPAYDFGVGTPDPALFPLETWRRLVTRELRGVVRSGDYAGPEGHAGLRAAIARHVGISRSVHAGPDDVLVTQGAQQALDLVGRVLLEPGDCVAVEEPGYRPARLLFHALGARVVGVPVDGEGLDVTAIPDEARLVYTTPSHQFPLGVAMSLPRRAALLAWARQRDAVVLEDDYDSEFRFSERPLEPLQSLDRGGRVVYVGTFAKTLLPRLRLGFLVAPTALRDALRAAKQLTDWHGDLTTQAALASFIEEGQLGRHIRKAARVYAARHERVRAALERDFTGVLAPVPSAAGLHLCALQAAGSTLDLAELERRAMAAGVAVRTLAGLCGQQGDRAGLALGYGAIPLDRIDDGLRLLATTAERRE